MSTTYNGWTNYETWNVALWIDNEEWSHRDWQDRCQAALDETDADDSLEDRRESAALEIATQLQDEITECAPDLGASMFADLLGAALSEVNWYEIAASWLSDLTPESDE